MTALHIVFVKIFTPGVKESDMPMVIHLVFEEVRVTFDGDKVW